MKLLYVAVACIYAVLLIFLLLAGLGFGFRIGGTMYAEEGFGFFRASSVCLFLVLLAVGVYLLWRRGR